MYKEITVAPVVHRKHTTVMQQWRQWIKWIKQSTALEREEQRERDKCVQWSVVFLLTHTININHTYCTTHTHTQFNCMCAEYRCHHAAALLHQWIHPWLFRYSLGIVLKRGNLRRCALHLLPITLIYCHFHFSQGEKALMSVCQQKTTLKLKLVKLQATS